MKKSILVLLILITAAGNAKAGYRLTASAPSEVAVGEQFRLTYTVNTQDADNFRAGSIPSAFEVLMGPSTSSQSSFTMVNGHTSSSSSITYTYILYAAKNGSFVIPPASVSIGGQTVRSQAVRIRVAGHAQNGGSGVAPQHQQSQPEMRSAGSRISGADLFITVSANKRRVHEQEPVVLTYKVYTLVDLTQLEGKMPDLKGFHSQEVTLPQQKSFSLERHNGRNYRTVTWSQYVLFPQQTGKLVVPSITFNGIVVQQNRNVDPFEAFFNGGSGYSEVKKSIQAPSLTIQVDPLPTKPSNFSGGVGHFSISGKLDKPNCKTGDAITLRVTVSGIGNIKLIKQPIVKFPKDFETYDAKVTDKTKLTQNGVEGQMIYDFLAVPRHQGKYKIPAVEFTYYDTSSDTYKTARTSSVQLNVAKGKDGNLSDYSEELKLLNQDIHFIKKGDVTLYNNDFFWGSTMYMLMLIIPFVIFVILCIVFRQKAIDAANVGKMRGKKANKVAVKRLKMAGKLLHQGKNNEFYDEVLKALWGYIGDKLNMPVVQLSKENISEKLSAANVEAGLIAQFTGAIEECEFARFAPGDKQGNMNKVYDTAISTITAIENSLKGKRTFDTAARLILLFVMLGASVGVQAMTKAEADSAYMHENYQKAIRGYEEILRGGENANIYYNLGNAYYRTNNITRAVLNYERAYLLNPGDGDIRFNLDLARSKTIDKITPASEMFFVSWYRSLVNITSVNGWAKIAVVSFILLILLALLYLFNNKITLRKIGFFGAAVMLAVFVLSNIFAYQQRDQLIHRTGAIVIATSSVKSTPAANGTDLFILHEGTKVTITDGSMKSWKEIKLADGKEGWIETTQIENI
jgi:tetratricopeptide (TPR) repeat protein